MHSIVRADSACNGLSWVHDVPHIQWHHLTDLASWCGAVYIIMYSILLASQSK